MKNKKLAVRIIAVSFAVMAFFAGCSGSDAGSVWIPTNGGVKYHKGTSRPFAVHKTYCKHVVFQCTL